MNRIAFVVAAAAAIAGAHVDAEEPSAAAGPAVPKTEGATPQLREVFLATAGRIELHSDANAVEQVTSELGQPDVTYDWCNRAGCVRDVSEGRATRMTLLWVKEGEKRYSLLVNLCGGLGSWRVANVMVYERDTKAGAFGTAPKPVHLTRKVDEGFFFGKCWRD